MGFLNRFFSSEQAKEDSFWRTVSSEEILDDILAPSNERPQVIFKHSNQCGTSFFAKKNLEVVNKTELEQVDLHLIDVIHQRMLSRYLSEKVGVRHESPQLFVLKEGQVIWSGSHHQVNADNLMNAINQALG